MTRVGAHVGALPDSVAVRAEGRVDGRLHVASNRVHDLGRDRGPTQRAKHANAYLTCEARERILTCEARKHLDRAALAEDPSAARA